IRISLSFDELGWTGLRLSSTEFQPPSNSPNEDVNLANLIEDPVHRFGDAIRFRTRHRWRRRQVQIPSGTQNISLELSEIMVNSVNGNSLQPLQAGEGSITAEERKNEAGKTCEINNEALEDEKAENKSDVEKGSDSDGSFFDCNICLDLARDPVVTCCGHLYCWPCLYRWLHLHSDAKECPVCKGEVTMKTVTPIYGRGSNTPMTEEDAALKIPLRPHARKVESLRQTIQRTALNFPMDEMIRRLGNRFDFNRDLDQPSEPDGSHETFGRSPTLLNRILTSRGIRREQISLHPHDDVGVLELPHVSGTEAGDTRLQSLPVLRSLLHRTRVSSLTSAFNTADRLPEGFLYTDPLVPRHQEQPPPPVEDRDSFSSIAAVINSESQMDTAVEIDSMVSHSTSSSRRRNDSLQVSDVDSGNSRAPRRRRLA
ncbi:E3 ubiquitin-protein ligase RNF5, partial [Cucurbita argyrosperma subsp. argyrosperma]